MQHVSVFIVDIYYPGLAAEIRSCADSDICLYSLFCDELAPRYGIEAEHIPLTALRGLLMHDDPRNGALPTFWNANWRYLEWGYAELRRQDNNVGWQTLVAEASSSFSQLLPAARACTAKVAEVLHSNWTFKELAELQPPIPQLEITMGDSFQNISSSSIINRSEVGKSFQSLELRGQAGVAEAMRELASVVAESKDQEAAEVFTALADELNKPTPKASLLKSLWTGLVSALPQLDQMTDLVQRITGLWR